METLRGGPENRVRFPPRGNVLSSPYLTPYPKGPEVKIPQCDCSGTLPHPAPFPPIPYKITPTSLSVLGAALFTFHIHISFDAPCTLMSSSRAGRTSFHRWGNKAQSDEEVKARGHSQG